MATSTSTTDLKGKQLGGFRVGELLGKGGMGAVFQGRDVNLDRPVAIKVLAPHLAEDAEYRDRFVREARVAAKLNHPNIVQIYRAAYEGGVTYMALELVTGCTLHQLLRQHPDFPARRACELVRDSARGLALAHEHGIVHRDLKPENILVTPKGRPKLADFGLARSADQRITATGMFLGTPQYASPEQCNGEEVTGRSDLYSLGVVLYELLAGRPPHEAPTPLALFQKILGEEHQPLSEVQPDLPPSLSAIVDRLLAKLPEERYADAEALIRDLDQVILALPEPTPEADPLRNIESAIVQAPAIHTKSTAPGLETSAGPAIVVPGVHDHGTVELSFEDQVASPDAVTVNLERPGAAAPVGPTRTVPLLVGILVLALAGLLIAKFLPTDGPDSTPTPNPTDQASAQGYHYPLRVAVLPWGNDAKADDFAWLGDALPGFVRSQLQRSGAIKIVAPAKVSKALRGLAKSIPRDERALALLAAVEADIVVSGSFYVVAGEGGDQVGINTQIEDARGDTIRFRLSPHVFPKQKVLKELKKLAQVLSETISAQAPPPPDSEKIVASAQKLSRPPARRKLGSLRSDLGLLRKNSPGTLAEGIEKEEGQTSDRLEKKRQLKKNSRAKAAPVAPADAGPPTADTNKDADDKASEPRDEVKKREADDAPVSKVDRRKRGRAKVGGRPERQPGGAKPAAPRKPGPTEPAAKTPAAKPKSFAQTWRGKKANKPEQTKKGKAKIQSGKTAITYKVTTNPLLLKLAAQKGAWDTWELGELLRNCVKCKTVEVHTEALKVLKAQDAETQILFQRLAEQLKQKLTKK